MDKKIKELSDKYLTMIKVKLEYMGFKDVGIEASGPTIIINLNKPYSNKMSFICFSKDSLYTTPRLKYNSNSLNDDLDIIWNAIGGDINKYFTYCINPIYENIDDEQIVEGKYHERRI